jgi:very-short-patch-repair endonuclease
MRQSWVGTSGFYINLAVHHPVIPSNFILGIECDGALFHSTPYVRDRDKIRQELLESRGWKIARVWSQDWSRDWKSEVGKLDMLIKKISGE